MSLVVDGGFVLFMRFDAERYWAVFSNRKLFGSSLNEVETILIQARWRNDFGQAGCSLHSLTTFFYSV